MTSLISNDEEPQAMPSTPAQQRATPEDADSAAATSQTRGTPLTPADCRTLDEIIRDVRSPLFASSHGSTGDGDESFISVTAHNEGSREAGEQFEHGNEADEGYVDEDESMDLSDVGESYAGGDERKSEVEDEEGGEDDTIEDIMNMPNIDDGLSTGQDIPKDYLQDAILQGKTEEIEFKRAAIENEVAQECLEQQRHLQYQRDGAVDVPGDSELEAVQAIHAQTGLSTVQDSAEDVWDESLEAFDRRASRCFSPGHASQSNTQNGPSATIQTPIREHTDSDPSAVMAYTPFTKTLNFYKQFKPCENSPAKSRRKNLMPKEIQELIHEAAEEEGEEEEEDLEKFREIDLAPMEPVPGNDRGGYLDDIQISTDSLNIARPFDQLSSETLEVADRERAVCQSETIDRTPDEDPSPESIEQSHALSLPDCAPENTTEVQPEPTTDPERMQMILYPQHPTFVNVIGLLPKALFWVAAARAANIANKAYDTMIYKLTGLEL